MIGDDEIRSSNNENDAVRDKREKAAPEPLLFDDHELSQEIARGLIREHHSLTLGSANFRFLCRNRAPKKGGQKVPGYIKKASPMERHIAGDECDFIMVVCLDVWNDFNQAQRTALVDHLLCRCVATESESSGEMKYSIRPPAVQEFPEIAERYGQWNPELVEMKACLNKNK